MDQCLHMNWSETRDMSNQFLEKVPPYTFLSAHNGMNIKQFSMTSNQPKIMITTSDIIVNNKWNQSITITITITKVLCGS